MTHEGLMARGEEKLSRGISDYETEYFLEHKPKEEVEKPKKEVKKSGKSNR